MLGVVNTGRPLQVKILGVATPAALTPMFRTPDRVLLLGCYSFNGISRTATLIPGLIQHRYTTASGFCLFLWHVTGRGCCRGLLAAPTTTTGRRRGGPTTQSVSGAVARHLVADLAEPNDRLAAVHHRHRPALGHRSPPGARLTPPRSGGGALTAGVRDGRRLGRRHVVDGRPRSFGRGGRRRRRL